MKKLPILIVASFVLVSCRKKAEELSANCRVKQTTETTVSNGHEVRKTIASFAYNADGTLAKVLIVESDRSSTRTMAVRYERFKGFIVVDGSGAFNGAEFKGIDTVTLDAQGRIIERYFPPNSSGFAQWEFISYDNAGQVIETRSFNPDTTYGLPDTGRSTYFWKDGNIERSNDYLVYDYYDTVYNVGIGNISLDDLETYGQSVFKIGKLTKTIKDTLGRTRRSYTYDLDKAKKITKVVCIDPVLDVRYVKEVSYDCK